jgi:hypothetical protein
MRTNAKTLFLSPISPTSSTNVVNFDDFSTDTVSLLLGAIYSQVDVAAAQVGELLRLSEYIRLDWLVELLVRNIRKQINEYTVFHWYEIAKGCGVVKLKFFCECYVRENLNKLQMEDVQRCFSQDVFDKVTSLWNSDLERQGSPPNDIQQSWNARYVPSRSEASGRWLQWRLEVGNLFNFTPYTTGSPPPPPELWGAKFFPKNVILRGKGKKGGGH